MVVSVVDLVLYADSHYRDVNYRESGFDTVILLSELLVSNANIRYRSHDRETNQWTSKETTLGSSTEGSKIILFHCIPP